MSPGILDPGQRASLFSLPVPSLFGFLSVGMGAGVAGGNSYWFGDESTGQPIIRTAVARRRRRRRGSSISPSFFLPPRLLQRCKFARSGMRQVIGRDDNLSEFCVSSPRKIPRIPDEARDQRIIRTAAAKQRSSVLTSLFPRGGLPSEFTLKRTRDNDQTSRATRADVLFHFPRRPTLAPPLRKPGETWIFVLAGTRANATTNLIGTPVAGRRRV